MNEIIMNEVHIKVAKFVLRFRDLRYCKFMNLCSFILFIYPIMLCKKL